LQHIQLSYDARGLTQGIVSPSDKMVLQLKAAVLEQGILNFESDKCRYKRTYMAKVME